MFAHKEGIVFLLLLVLNHSAFGAFTVGDRQKSVLPVEEILMKADERIDKHRKSDGRVLVLDDEGKPIRGAHVEIEQVSHEFLFGCNIFMLNKSGDAKFDKAYRDQFAGLLNYATLPFYWWGYEKKRGAPDYAGTERYVKWCRENGITVKGHPLVWNHQDPAWLPGDLDEIHDLQMRRITDCVERFKGVVDIWDVVNEPTDFERLKDKKMTKIWQKAGKIPFTLEAFERARKKNPDALLLINDYKTGEGYEEVIKKLVDDGGNKVYDAIGIQSHMHSGAWTVEKMWDVCDRFSKFGVPIHFTEVTVLSGKLGWSNPKPWDSTEEGEKYQAEHAERLYTVLFSHPAVEAITWWDFSDRGTWMGAPAGLIRKDGTPKPAYQKLKLLIKKKWWTKISGKTDRKGELKFRGFRGKYKVKVSYADQIITKEIELTKGGKNEVVIKVPADVDH